MPPLLRRSLAVVLSTVVVAGAFAAPAGARSRPGRSEYQRAVTITFPTVRSARYSDDYAGYRSGGRSHAATDLFARAGSPVYAARGGYVVWRPSRPSGNAGYAIQIRGDDGRTYAYYHLGPARGPLHRAVASRVRPGARIANGQRIGWVGDSGNARGGSPHLHFEIHDPGVTDRYGLHRRNPYPSLRRAQGLRVVRRSSTGDRWTGGSSSALHIGSRGSAVARWQADLNRSGRAPRVAVDGAFGPRTHRATVIFQRRVGLGPAGLGIVGPRSRAAMHRVIARSSPASRASTRTTSADSLLRIGSRGPSVAAWQRGLNRTGMAPRLVADGVFGPATHRATVIFQRKVGLGPAGLGLVGPLSRAALARRT